MHPNLFDLSFGRMRLNVQIFNLFGLALLLICIASERCLAQELPLSRQSIAEAARNSRDLKNNGKHPQKVITNEDLAPQNSALAAAERRFLDTVSSAQEPLQPAPKCETNREGLRLKSEIDAAQSELESLRRQASLPQTVISDHDLDPQYFKPGGSGLNVGAPGLLDDKPPVPDRVSAVQVEERIDGLQKLLRALCEPPVAAGLQLELDSAQRELDLAARGLALDRADFYARPDFTGDTAGQQRIQAEEQRVQDLQAQVDRLKAEVAAKLAQNSAS